VNGMCLPMYLPNNLNIVLVGIWNHYSQTGL
jgi:hypothetical protein